MSITDAAYPDSVILEFYNETQWVDISAYCVSDISGFHGFGSNTPEDRVATLGTLSFKLDNSKQFFSPMGGDVIKGLSTLDGFNKGAKIRIRVLYEDSDKVIWIGRINSINIDGGLFGNRRVKVIAEDWMDIPSRYPMKGSEILLDKKINEATNSILSRLSIQPESTNFDVGNNVFPAVFDNVKDRTKAVSEINKLSLSELGYVYLLKDGTLRVENSSARVGTRNLDSMVTPSSISGNLLLEDSDILLFEDGVDCLISEVEVPDLSAIMDGLDIESGKDIINTGYVRAYPTKTDTSLINVFSLGHPLYIAGKTTIRFTGYYTNPNGGDSINATNLQTPTITTDYLMNTLENGTGTNLSSDLIVTATYYGDLVDYTLTNNNIAGAWVTRLNARGYGIYKTSPIQSSAEDLSSINKYGESIVEIDQKYQTNLYDGDGYIKTVVEDFKSPRSRIKKVTYLANTNASYLMSFLTLDVGSLIHIYEDISQQYKYYYINSINFNITLGKVISVTYGLTETNSLLSEGLKQLKTRFSVPGRILDYGYIPSTSNLNKITISGWVYLYTIAGRLVWNLTNTDGFSFGIGGTNQLQWYQQHSSAVGVWTTPNNSLAINTLYHCVITRDTSTNSTESPKIYINGVLQPLTEVSTPVGAINSDMGLNLRVGNSTMIADIQDPRVYNRVLSQSEITTLYNSGTPDNLIVTDGLVFQGLCMYADDVTPAMESNSYKPEINSKMIDNIKRYVCEVKESRGWTKIYPGNSQGWLDVAWSPQLNLFAACGNSGTGRIMTSPDGITWTVRTTTGNPALYAITWSSQKNMFVAVGTGACMTSTDGVTWTSRTVDSAYDWRGVTYSPDLGLFAACAISGTSIGDRIMTSSDGIAWTKRSCPSGAFQDIAWGNGYFTAIRYTGSSTRAVFSMNGINWGNSTTPATLDVNDFHTVTYSPTLNRFVALGIDCCMYSSNAVTWYEVAMPVASFWRDVAWSSELGKFYVVADAGTYRLASSADGINWTEELAVVNNSWSGLVWSTELRIFVAVAYTGTSETVMLY